MTNKKVTRRALLMSVTSLLICISMLLGTTFAWFTDEVTSGVNQIVAGNLDVELEHVNGSASGKIDNTTMLFNSAAAGHLWEPGAVAYETFTVKNEGSLALAYELSLVNGGNNTVKDTTRSLLDVIKVGIFEGAPTGTTREALITQADTANQWDTLGNYISKVDNTNGKLDPKGTTGDTDSKTFTVVLYWPSDTDSHTALTGSVKDNDYNLKNGLESSDGQPLYVNLGVYLLAKQYTQENDSFDNQYDADATYPTVQGIVSTATSASTLLTKAANESVNSATVSTTSTPLGTGNTTVKLTESGTDSKLKEETPAPGETITKAVTLETTTTDTLASSATYEVDNAAGTAVASVDLTLTVTKTVTPTSGEPTVTSETVSNGFTAEVETYIAKNLEYPVTIKYGSTETWKATDNETALTLPGDNTVGVAKYDQATGKLTFLTNHFSDYVVYSNIEAVNATTNVAYALLNDAITNANANDTITLLKDVTVSTSSKAINNYNIGNACFAVDTPITIDGNGKKITASGNAGGYVFYFMNSDETETAVHYCVKNLDISSTGIQAVIITNCWNDNPSRIDTIKVSNVTVICDGECAYVNGYSSVEAENCVFMQKGQYAEGKDAVYYSAGIVGYAGSLTFKNSKISSFANGVATFPSGGSVKLINTEVETSNDESFVIWSRIGNGSNATSEYSDSNIEVSSGNYKGKFKITDTSNIHDAHITITGGTFDHDPSEYVAEGYIAVPNEDGTSWTVEATWNKYADASGVVNDETNKTLTINTAAGLAYYNAHCTDYNSTDANNRYTIKLGANIDLAGHIWTPISGVSNIVFDGQNKTISNMTSTSKSRKDIGLFRSIYASTVKDLIIDNAYMIGIGRVGGIVGYQNSGYVENCTVKNSKMVAFVYKNDDGDKVGAISGYLSGEPNAGISDCTVENVTLVGYRDIGSIVGYAGCYGPKNDPPVEPKYYSTTAKCYVKNNTSSNVTIINNQTNNYKNYTTNELFDVGEIIGDTTSDLDWSDTYRDYSNNEAENFTIKVIQ